MNVIVMAAAGLAGWILTPPHSCVHRRWRDALRQRRSQNIRARLRAVSARWRARRVRIDSGQLAIEIAQRLRAGASIPDACERAFSRRDISRDDVARDIPELTAALTLATHSGAPLADVLDRVAAGIGEAQAAHHHRRLALVGPVATARLLAALPLAGIAMGAVLGAHPVSVLLDGSLGTLSGLVGIIVGCIGIAWMRRLIAAAVEDRS
ncbi:type II secretion system F family protein [Nanchangia anserum]|uniref:Type II secretion system F family protein n=1 Tax=Nanchangia anserum TaxID=2692125 RepID=A0A8I0GB72_9ACTO|nr:type II secretion system F family protein [Nanchangia anserum]MBD3689578.1 type II secretion system F family protein [Nanchangia anserum]QOX81762.1 type II secretion system F family protein [Nanchangia anserum]